MKRVGIIAASGRSSRTGLGEYTTKAALPLFGRPLLLHQIDFLRRSDYDLIYVVCQPAHVRLLGSMLDEEMRRQVVFLLSEAGGGWGDKIEKVLPFLDDSDQVAIVPCDNYQRARHIPMHVFMPRADAAGGGLAAFSYTSYASASSGTLTDGPVFGRREGEDVWREQPSRGFVGDLFTGYIIGVCRGLRSTFEKIGLSPRGEKEITSLLGELSAQGVLAPIPYDGDYIDIADLSALARVHASVSNGAVSIGAGVLLHVGSTDVKRVFLTERQDGRGWVPPGGAVDKGETYAHAAARELQEEAGITVDERDLRLLGVYPTLGKRGEPACSVIFHTCASLGNALVAKTNKREVRDTAWVTREMANDLKIPFDLGKAVDDCFAGRELDCRP